MQLCDNNREFTFSVCSFIGTHFFILGEIFMKNDAEMYRKMYCKLFNTITDVLQICEDDVCSDILKNAQRETEELYTTYYE